MNEYPTSALDPIVLGRANPLYYNFSNPSGQMPGWVHNSVWRTVNGGEDPTNYPFVNGEPVYHGMMRFNFHPNISWNFDPQNVLSAPQFDLYSVVLHEICHLLGFASLVTDNGTSDIDPLGGYTPSNSGLYTNYDRLLVRNESSYSPLLSPVNNCYDITFQGNINVLTDPCNVILLRDVNTGLYLPVVAPNGWIDNVEMSHLDDIGGPFACNSTHYLMNRSVIQNALGQSFRRPTDAEINLLCSMGYKSSGVYGDGSLSFHSVVSGNNPPACGEFVAGVDDDGANCHDHFVFCELPGTISISTILANDIGVLPNIDANCIEPVVGNITFTAGTSDITINSASFGWNVLAYIPTNATTNELANTTFIYFYVGCDGCTNSEACNEICNPHINSDCTFPNYPSSNLANNRLSACSNMDGWHSCFRAGHYYPQSDIGSLSFPSNDGCIGLYAREQLVAGTTPIASQSSVVVNSTNIQAGQSYIISLHRAVVTDYDCCDNIAQADHLNVLLINNNDLICGDINTNMLLQLTNPPLSQLAYHETNLPIGGWEQGIACFTANNDYDRMLIYGEQNTPDIAYILLDELSIMPDEFPNDMTITVNCDETATLDVGCTSIPNMSYRWEQQDPTNPTNWIDVGIDAPSIVTDPVGGANSCLVYRVSRNMNSSSPTFPLANDWACVEQQATFTVCSNCCDNPQDPSIAAQCCLSDIAYDLKPTTAVPNIQTYNGRLAFVVANGVAGAYTWTSVNNELIDLGLVTAGNPINSEVDIVVPNGVTLTIRGMHFFFAPTARIFVDRGGILDLLGFNETDMNSLDGLCKVVWQGIQVAGPGAPNAFGGVFTPRASGGANFGILTTRNTQIKNAIIGVSAMELPLMDPFDLSLSILNTPEFSPQNANIFPTVSAYLIRLYCF